ncbi:MAG: DUF5058 family protein [Oscillospiraceae bacterium]|nr:DUF5058 family protein [Oscillospiraceae bacterium]
MSYYAVSEHWLTYVVVAAGILFVLAFTAAVLRRALRHARKLGFTKEQLRRVVRIAVSCTLVPAVTVLIGFLLLAPMLGIPLSWWRLSVIGNTAYEIMAANMALSTSGASAASPGTASGTDFILVMYVMAIGIMGGMVLAPLLSKRVHQGTFRIREKDWRWGALGVSTYIAAVLLVFTVPMLFRLSAALLTLVTGAALMSGMKWLAGKPRAGWLGGFAFTISTFVAMVLSVLWDRLLV